MDRRDFIKTAAAAGIVAGFQPLSLVARANTGNSELPLKQYAATRGLLYGAAVGSGYIKNYASYAGLVAKQCSIIVPEWEMKWAALYPALNRFDFTGGDALLAFAHDHGIALRGHTLVWHDALPKWFDSYATQENARELLQGYIKTVVGRYSGKMHSWDVVNEAIATWDSDRADCLRNSPWLKLLGPDYIEMAFRSAHEADPNALLVYNQNHVEYDDSNSDRTRAAVLGLLRRLKEKGVPVHALGVQAHLTANKYTFNANKLRQFLQEVSDMGLKILITEMDVRDSYVHGSADVIDKAVADAYDQFLETVLENTSVIAVLTWGLSDKYSWLTTYAPRDDKQAVRPLPFDYDMNPTQSFYALKHAFDSAPKR
jgi:endo-1,4-beta-xylanase